MWKGTSCNAGVADVVVGVDVHMFASVCLHRLKNAMICRAVIIQKEREDLSLPAFFLAIPCPAAVTTFVLVLMILLVDRIKLLSC